MREGETCTSCVSVVFKGHGHGIEGIRALPERVKFILSRMNYFFVILSINERMTHFRILHFSFNCEDKFNI